MESKNIYEPIFEKSCAVCSNKYMADIYGQGKCSHCGWRNGDTIEENENNVVYPNLISLNKAKQLYKEGKSFEPNLDEFIEALFCYGEVQFEYNGIYYGVEININNEDINEFYVWIPRYKYRLWNVTGSRGIDSYNAYNTGIDIVFEKQQESSGVINCESPNTP